MRAESESGVGDLSCWNFANFSRVKTQKNHDRSGQEIPSHYEMMIKCLKIYLIDQSFPTEGDDIM